MRPCPICGLFSSRGPCSNCGFRGPISGPGSSCISATSTIPAQPASASAAPTASLIPNWTVAPDQPSKILSWSSKGCYYISHHNPSDYFNANPILIKVTDANDGLHMLLTPNPRWPWLVTEGGKFSLKSLKDVVVQAHKEGWTIGKEQLSLTNLTVSSIGTFQFKNEPTKYILSDGNQIEDFLALSDTMLSLLKLLHGNDIGNYLPEDLNKMITDLRCVTNPKLDTLWIDFHPALLPVTCYGPAYMKLHGLFIEEGKGLLTTHNSDASALLTGMPYRTKGVADEDWTMIAANDPWLKRWFNHIPGRYDVMNERQVIIFPRHVIAHCLSHRGLIPKKLSPTARARLLGGPGNQSAAVLPYYHPEAVFVLLQYRFPKWLPHLMRGVINFCDSANMMDLFHQLRFHQLFQGVSGCFVK